MAVLTLDHAALSFDPRRPLLVDASLVVDEQDRIGLVGPNGCGKSTLLRILAGLETRFEGQRTVRRGLRLGFLEQEPHFDAALSLRAVVHSGIPGRAALLQQLEEVYQRMAASDDEGALQRWAQREQELQHRLESLGGHRVDHRIEAALHGIGLEDPDRSCAGLSGGEARRLALARLLVSEPDLLLLDEPTNHLDAFVIAWFEEQLAALAKPMVLVTHDRHLLDRVVDRVVEIDRGRTYPSEGGYRAYVARRAARLAGEEQGERSRLNLLRRETAWMKAGAPARSTKAKARIQRYQALVDAAPPPISAELEMQFPPGRRLGAKVLELHRVTHSYGDRQVLPPLDLRVEQGMRLGVVGPNGAGKSTLLKILLQRLQPTAGEVVCGETVVFGTIDQRREDLDPDATVVKEVAGSAQHVKVGEQSVHVISFLDRFLFPGDAKHATIGSLSGGERGRVLLAKLMLTGANLLVLDEPTNDLDLMTLRALEEALLDFSGSVVVVSHDRWFLDRVATHILHLDGQGKAHLHTGDLSSLIEALGRDAPAPEPKATSAPARPAATPPPPNKSGLASWEQRELEQLTARIESNDLALTELDAQLADPELYRRGGEAVRALQQERERLQAEGAAWMARWEELAEREG